MRRRSLKMKLEEEKYSFLVISTSNAHYQIWKLILIISYFSSANSYSQFAAFGG